LQPAAFCASSGNVFEPRPEKTESGNTLLENVECDICGRRGPNLIFINPINFDFQSRLSPEERRLPHVDPYSFSCLTLKCMKCGLIVCTKCFREGRSKDFGFFSKRVGLADYGFYCPSCGELLPTGPLNTDSFKDEPLRQRFMREFIKDWRELLRLIGIRPSRRF
jgi:hypothetical protein